jgi:hypothetical protein
MFFASVLIVLLTPHAVQSDIKQTEDTLLAIQQRYIDIDRDLAKMTRGFEFGTQDFWAAHLVMDASDTADLIVVDMQDIVLLIGHGSCSPLTSIMLAKKRAAHAREILARNIADVEHLGSLTKHEGLRDVASRLRELMQQTATALDRPFQ